MLLPDRRWDLVAGVPIPHCLARPGNGDIAPMRSLSAAAVLVISLAAVAGAAKPKFTSTWKSPAAQALAYAGKKVVGLIISPDMSLRMSAEEALAQQLTAKGVQGV